MSNSRVVTSAYARVIDKIARYPTNWKRVVLLPSTYMKGRIGWQGLKASEFLQTGPYLITGTDFINGKINWDTCYHISLQRFEEAPLIQIKNDDVLITKDGTIGKVAFVTNCPKKAILNSGVLVLRCKDDSYDHKYLYYVLNSVFFDKFIAVALGGSTINHLYQRVFEQFEFPVPPSLPEQRKIARIFSNVDAVIEKTEAAIAKYKAIKQGMMRDLFTRGLAENGRLRPRYEDAPHLYKHTELGWMPKEWAIDKLGNILKRYGGYLQTGPFGSQLHAHEYQHEGIPVVMPQNINDGLIGTDQIARIHEQRANDLVRHRMSCGDIVIARRGELSRAAAISIVEEGWVCGTGCFLLRLKQSSLNADYTAYVYRQDFIQRQIAANAVGSTMPSLNNKIMAELFFPYCDEAEQIRIVDRLEAIDRNIRTYQSFLSKKLLFKQGLMSDLLTGKMRVTTDTVM